MWRVNHEMDGPLVAGGVNGMMRGSNSRWALAVLGGLACCLTVAWAEPGDGGVVLLNLAELKFAGGTPAADGVGFRFDMGTRRVNWTNARWSQVAFDPPRDWSTYGGLRLTVHTDQPRKDAGVYIALREADGSWHYQGWATELTGKQNVGVVRFADFRPATWVAPHVFGMPQDFLDENQILDTDSIAGLAVGCINPLGVGEVSFVLEAIELIPRDDAVPEPVTLTISGELIDINGTTVVPAGLFGHFPGGGSPEMRMGSHREIFKDYIALDEKGGVVEHPSFSDPAMAVLLDVEGGDRYQTSGRLTNPNWQRDYRSGGLSAGKRWRAYRDQAAARGWNPEIVFEWWNEPYLNWSNHSRKNFGVGLYDVSRATEGGPVHLKVDGSVAPYLRWTQQYDAPPWQWMSREKWGSDADPTWQVYDVTQFTFWSGQSQLKFYNEPLLAYARGLHEVAPDAPLIAGWDFRCSEDHWAGFNMLYKPTIDAAIEHIIGVTDHDYGGDVTRMPANYELVTAYGMAYHGKWLYSYDTECGENSDPSAIPAASDSMRQAGKNWLKCMWSARKIVHALATVPDKARSFTFHWFSKGGEGVTWMALRNLRGKLLHVASADPDLFAVASIDGTDPRQRRPDYVGDGKELVVALFNDRAEPRRVRVPITAPQGMRFDGGTLRQPAVDPTNGVVALTEHPLESAGATALWEGEIPSKTLVVLSYKVTGEEPSGPRVLRRQFFADDILKIIEPGLKARGTREGQSQPGLVLKVNVPEAERVGVRRAWLRCVFERLAEGEGQVHVNDQVIDLPSCQPPENVAWIRDIPIPVASLQSENELRFVASDGRAGYLLVMASIMIERDAKMP